LSDLKRKSAYACRFERLLRLYIKRKRYNHFVLQYIPPIGGFVLGGNRAIHLQKNNCTACCSDPRRSYPDCALHALGIEPDNTRKVKKAS
jgi:hypothetical protein